MEILQPLAVAAVFLAAGGVKGVTGMGLPTVAVSLLGLWMLPGQAAALLVLPTVVTNVVQSLGPHWRTLLRRLWPAWIGLAACILWTPEPGRGPGGLDARVPLGVVLVAYGLLGLWRPRLPAVAPGSRWIGAAVGAVTGVITALTAVFAIPLVPYLQALRLERDALVQALGMSFMVATLALGARLQSAGVPLLSPVSGVALAAALCGLWVGARLRARIGATAFQRALFAVFVALGATNLLRGL